MIYYQRMQNQLDIDFYEKADAFFDRMGRINHDALNPLLAQHFRIGPFGEFDRTRIASVVAVDAWKIAKPIFFSDMWITWTNGSVIWSSLWSSRMMTRTNMEMP